MSKSHLARTHSLKRSWLAKVLLAEHTDQERKYCVEPLERRELMAADLTDFLGSNDHQNTASNSAYYSQNDDLNALSTQAEGENNQDLVAFATALRDAGVILYGAAWDTGTAAQLRIFEDGANFITFVDVTNPDRSRKPIADTLSIAEPYPTWEFQNGNKVPGALTLAQISQHSGIAIPTSTTNVFLNAIPNASVQINSPFHVPLDGFSSSGSTLTYTVTSSNPSAVTAQVIQGGKSARISTNFGDMTFRLFEAEAGRATARFIQLAQSGFYNTTGSNSMTFHRVINNFMIQGGDPTGTGGGNSGQGVFDDILNVNLQHNRSGVLSFAKSPNSDDSNDSQFFVVEGNATHLNGNHSVFGQLIEGESVREAISGTTTNSSDKPTNNVVIQSITIFDDLENGLVRLKSVGAAGSTSTITVTATDSTGNSTSRTFTATAAAKAVNDQPFLNDFNDDVTTTMGTPVTVQLSSQDAEGDPVTYFVNPAGSSGVQFQASVNSSGLVTITPPANYSGTFNVTVGVRRASGAAEGEFDTQVVKVTVTDDRPPAPTGVSLNTSSDTGVSNSDRITNATSLTFTVSGTQTGATVELLRDGVVIGSQVATGTTTTITTTSVTSQVLGSITARQTVNSKTSVVSPSITLLFDNTAAAQVASNLLPTTALAGTAVSANLGHAEEGAGLRYAFSTAPTGATINAETGVITWTPTTGQVGSQAFTMTLTDAAGNVTTQNFSVTVSLPPLASISVSFVDMNGSPIFEIGLGQTFKVRLTATDLRPDEAEGIFSAYLDLLYNQNLVALEGSSPITYPGEFSVSQFGNTSTAGLINELGAARSSQTPSGDAPILFAEVTMKALAAGQAIFTAEAADDVGSDVAVYDSVAPFESEIPVDRIRFNGASLAVGRSFDANNDARNVNENAGDTTIDVLTNDTIRSGGSLSNLTITAVGTPSAGGTVTISGQNVIYKPKAGFIGQETFTYTVKDTSGAEDTATVTITVVDVNAPPVATNDSLQVAQNSTSNTLNVLQNDSIAPDTGETLTITSVGTTSNGGTVTISQDKKSLIYTPKSGYNGFETFTYTISDGRGGSATATVTMNVGSTAPPPTAVDDNYTVAEDAANSTYNVLSNDTPAASGQTLSIGTVTANKGGTVSVVAGGGGINYRPAANFNGTEIVTYQLIGSNGGRTLGTATFTVTAVNDPPNAVDDTFTVLSDPNQSLSVLANDTNVDSGETLTISAVSTIDPAKGTLTISADKTKIIYNPPNADFEGTVTFTYTLGDGSSLTDTATVTLNVRNYTPRSIGGWISFQSNTNNPGGIALTLSGTASSGEAITRQLTTDGFGKFKSDDLPPGQYTITVNPLAFRGGGTQTLSISSDQEDGDSLNNILKIADILPQYVNFRDFLGSVSGRGFTVAVAAGSTQQWVVTNGAWRGFQSVKVALNAEASTMTVTATTRANTTTSQTVTVKNNKRVTVREQNGNMYYLQINGEPVDLGFTNPSQADINANVNGAASGQAAALAAASLQSSSAATDLALQGLDAEGEGNDGADLSDFFGSLDVEDELNS